MHDVNGNVLKKGDRVLIPAVITDLSPGADFCNVSLESGLGRRPDGKRETFSAINTGILVKWIPIVLLLLCWSAPAFGQEQRRVTSAVQGIDAWTQANRQGVGVVTMSQQKEMAVSRFDQAKGEYVYTYVPYLTEQDRKAESLSAYLAAAVYTGGGATDGPGVMTSCPCGAACVCGPNCRCPEGCPANCPCQIARMRAFNSANCVFNQAAQAAQVVAQPPAGRVWVCRNGRCSLQYSLPAYLNTAQQPVAGWNGLGDWNYNSTRQSSFAGSCGAPSMSWLNTAMMQGSTFSAGAGGSVDASTRQQRRELRRQNRQSRRTSYRMSVFGN